MARYPLIFVSSKMVQRLICIGYVGSAMLAVASIYYDLWLLLSALMLFAFTYDAEQRERASATNIAEQLSECDECGGAMNGAGAKVRICPPVVISPWLITFRVESAADSKQRHSSYRWFRIWQDQVAPADWARLRRIGITLNAPLRRH